MKIIGLTPIFDKVQNPISWINQWTGGSTQTQNSPQETEIESYISGAFKQDVDDESYDEFSF
jgi:ribonucleotide reductase beta subunit family protein with ferritin-like domain